MPDSPVEIRWKKSQSRTLRSPKRCGSGVFVEDKNSRYDIGECIAKTKGSEVSLAYDTKHDHRKVIIKKPNEDIIFKAELAALNRLHDHKNIICLLDFYTVDTHRFLVYEYVEGQDLIDWVNEYYELKHTYLEIEDTMRPICKQLLDALLYCHKNGVAHRDVKLDNIRINTTTKDIKLLDFGFSFTENSKMNSSTRCGSLDYAAPELVLPEVWDIIDPYKSDVWSFGVVVYVLTHYMLPYFQTKRGNYVLDKPDARFSCHLNDLLILTLQEDVTMRIQMSDVEGLSFFE